MDSSKPKLQSPSAPSVTHRARRRQFTTFGLMVLMFVLSIAFSQLYYWRQAELRWEKQRQEQIENEKQAAQGQQGGGNSGAVIAPTTQNTASAKSAPEGNSGDAAIAILMAVALPMLVMIIASVAYNVRKWLRRRRRSSIF